MTNFLKAFNFSRVCAVYSSFVTLWYLLWLSIGDEVWWIVLLNRAATYLFIPAFLLLASALLIRRIRSALSLLFPILIFVTLYYPYFIPKPAKSVDESASLEVMTYNVLFSNSDYGAVADVILTYQPDLVALQEVQPDMMSALITRLQNDYPHYLMGTRNNFGTTAVFSRHAFLDTQVLDLQADRPAVIVKTRIMGRVVTFVSVHLLAYNLWWTALKDVPATVMKRTRDQNRQANLVLQAVSDESGMTIIGCDCNSYETSSSYRILDGSLENAARQTGFMISLVDLPGIRQDTSLTHIDYVWSRGDIAPMRVFKILDNGGSDHLPVLATFEMD